MAAVAIRVLRIETTGAIGASDNLKKMAVGIVKINAPPIIPAINGARLFTEWISPICKASLFDALEDGIELCLTGRKIEMALCNCVVGFDFNPTGNSFLTLFYKRREPVFRRSHNPLEFGALKVAGSRTFRRMAKPPAHRFQLLYGLVQLIGLFR